MSSSNLSGILEGLGNESIPTIAGNLLDTRYMQIAGLTILFYDALLTFDWEVDVIWSQSWTFQKAVFVIYRYSACIWSAFYLSLLAAIWDYPLTWCAYAASSHISLDILIESIGNGIVLYVLITLWNADRKLSFYMAIGYIAAHTMILLYGVLTIRIIHDPKNTKFLPVSGYRMCVTLAELPTLKGIYIPAVAQDAYSFALFLGNALSLPRHVSTRLLSVMWNDGLLFFVTTLSVRMMCLLLITSAPRSLSILGLGFAGTLSNALVSRLYLRLKTKYSMLNDKKNGCERDELQDI